MAAKVIQKGTKSLDSEDNGDMDEKLLKKTASFASRYYRRRSLKTERKQDNVLVSRGPFAGKERFFHHCATTDSQLHHTFPQQVEEQQANVLGEVLQEGANVLDEAAELDESIELVSAELIKVADGISNIVDKKVIQRIDYAVYMEVVRESMREFGLNVRDTLWALFEVGAQFFRREEQAGRLEDDAVLAQWPGQAMYELGLQGNKKELDELMQGTSVD